MKKQIEVKGKVELFPQKGGWYYIRVPKKITKLFSSVANRGLIPIKITLGSSVWDSSLLPMGDGTHFIALKAAVRKKEGIDVGDRIRLHFQPRLR